MKEFSINKNQAGQRFDKMLVKLMPEAGMGFLYKMLRKKNITLNGKKAEGKEILQQGDLVKIFFSDETFEKLSGLTQKEEKLLDYEAAYKQLNGISILFEDENALIVNKPAGILSQKALPQDLSLNEWLIGYLLETGKISKETLKTFVPSICNRLDRNTSGLVLCGISLSGSQELNALVRSRKVKKFYRLLVKGELTKTGELTGYLRKDEKTNHVFVLNSKDYCQLSDAKKEAYSPIHTRYHVLKSSPQATYLEVELITGKTHQIRAHLASIQHPLVGDRKYGSSKEFPYQLLHSYRLEFPILEGSLKGLSEKIILAEIPALFKKGIERWQLGIQEDFEVPH